MCPNLRIPHQGFGKLDVAAKLLGRSANTREESRAKGELVIYTLAIHFKSSVHLRQHLKYFRQHIETTIRENVVLKKACTVNTK
jgi:hypothetical protein